MDRCGASSMDGAGATGCCRSSANSHERAEPFPRDLRSATWRGNYQLGRPATCCCPALGRPDQQQVCDTARDPSRPAGRARPKSDSNSDCDSNFERSESARGRSGNGKHKFAQPAAGGLISSAPAHGAGNRLLASQRPDRGARMGRDGEIAQSGPDRRPDELIMALAWPPSGSGLLRPVAGPAHTLESWLIMKSGLPSRNRHLFARRRPATPLHGASHCRRPIQLGHSSSFGASAQRLPPAGRAT